MKWSKLKQLVEELLCESLKGRVHYHVVVHRKSHDQTETFRVTFDGEEVFRASDMPFNMKAYSRELELRKERELDPLKWVDNWREMFESEELKLLHAAAHDAEVEVKERGMFPSYEVKTLLFDYIQMPFEEAVQHEHPFIRALTLFDRRFGSRRLRAFQVDKESEVVKRFYEVRTNVAVEKKINRG